MAGRRIRDRRSQVKTYTAGDMHHAWHRGWMAGWSDYSRDEVELTQNPYEQKSGLETPAKKSLQTANEEDESPMKEHEVLRD